eukprot:1158854-Pelagomonas_calceolata.AAC.2
MAMIASRSLESTAIHKKNGGAYPAPSYFLLCRDVCQSLPGRLQLCLFAVQGGLCFGWISDPPAKRAGKPKPHDLAWLCRHELCVHERLTVKPFLCRREPCVYERLTVKLFLCRHELCVYERLPGFEIGSGFAGSRMLGSEHNDEFYMSEDNELEVVLVVYFVPQLSQSMKEAALQELKVVLVVVFEFACMSRAGL